MMRFTRTAAVVLGGWVLVSGAQAGPLTKLLSPNPPVSPYRPQVAPTPAQTAPPPLLSPVSAPTPAGTAPTGAPKNLPNDVAPAEPAWVAPAVTQPRSVIVNTKQVQLSYDFKDVGPSGVAGVEVWYTRDGKGWMKFDGIQRENPVWVDLEEGTYGLLLVARTGFGGGREAPTLGDQPQIWVQVDVTKPVVFFNGVHQTNGSRTLNINWTARDENFGRNPINIYYAEQTSGPWLPIATALENVGEFAWQIPLSTPASFYVRVEAIDLAGNVGQTTTPDALKIDLTQPGVTNIRLNTQASGK